MTEVPLGIELNGASTTKCHVNSYYADCGHGDLELDAKWPEDAVKKSQAAGGICHINHVKNNKLCESRIYLFSV